MPPSLLRFWVLVKREVKSTWMVPVLCVAAALLYAAVIGPHAALRSASHAWALLGEVTAALALLSFALLLVWLVGSMFLKQTFGQRGLRVLFPLLGGGTALVIVVGVSLFEAFADNDHAADHWRVPEGVALEVPQEFWVVAKVASTLDAKMVRQCERWISDPEALKHAHQLRLTSDAILVGGETVRRDNPALTIRTPLTAPSERKEQPWRIVMTKRRDTLPADAKVFTDEHRNRTLVFENVNDYPEILQRLYKDQGIITLMLECGGTLLKEFLDRGLVNEWMQDIAPILSGGEAQAVPGDFLANELHLKHTTTTRAGRDIIVRGILQN